MEQCNSFCKKNCSGGCIKRTVLELYRGNFGYPKGNQISFVGMGFVSMGFHVGSMSVPEEDMNALFGLEHVVRCRFSNHIH